MKKSYTSPEIEFALLISADILAASNPVNVSDKETELPSIGWNEIA